MLFDHSDYQVKQAFYLIVTNKKFTNSQKTRYSLIDRNQPGLSFWETGNHIRNNNDMIKLMTKT